MNNLLTPLINYLHSLSGQVPLPLFVSVGAALEEIIAPIPSPLVMTLTGSLTSETSIFSTTLLWLAIVGSLAKTAASYLVYFISDKAEDFVMNKMGKYLGVSHKEVEKLGAQLSGGWKDHLIMLVLRGLPIIPTAPISVISGLLKLDLKMFIWTTLLGYTVRNYFYLYLGATSVNALESVNNGLNSFENIGYLIIFAGLVAATFYFYKKRQEENILVKILRKLGLS